jgi:hypothetical protein
VTLAERLLQRVGIGPRAMDHAPALIGPDLSLPSDEPAAISVVPADGQDDVLADIRTEELEDSPLVGPVELRAAASMVAEGLALRVTLAGFGTWPGLLTEIESLSRQYDVTILPTIVRPGGRVDLVVFRQERYGG